MASFYVIRGKDNGQHFAIRGVNATIGREPTNQIQLRDTEVSRLHARIIRTAESQFEIVDCDSSNGTHVNSRRVQTQVLRSGDRVQVGRTLMIFTGGPELYSTASAHAVEIVTHGDRNDLSQIRNSLDSSNKDNSQLLQPDANPRNMDLTQGPLSHSVNPQDSNSWEIVYQVSQAINRTIDLDELLTQVLDLIFQWIEADRGCILMIDDITGLLTPIHSRDRKSSTKAQTPVRALKPLKISRTILDFVVSKKEGVLTSNAQDDSRWQDAESVTSLGVHEAMCVPMLGRYGLVGAIYVDTSMSAGVFADRAGVSTFNEQHLKLMVAIAGQAALAIEDTQFYRAMLQSERLAAMGQTIANLSHHVKNILQGLSGGSYLVGEGLKNDSLELVRKGWRIVERNQSRISNLVMDMLTFSKEREPQLERSDVRAMIDEIAELMQTRAAESQVELVWHRPEQTLPADFDAEAMHRAILNVVTNAIDAANPLLATAEEIGQDHSGPPSAGKVRGCVTIDAVFEDNFVLVSVADDGIGIPEEDRPRIFSPFESSKGSRGTGLGLPVSQKILREHGGDIIFTSEVGSGSTFVLRWLINQMREARPTQVE